MIRMVKLLCVVAEDGQAVGDIRHEQHNMFEVLARKKAPLSPCFLLGNLKRGQKRHLAGSPRHLNNSRHLEREERNAADHGAHCHHSIGVREGGPSRVLCLPRIVTGYMSPYPTVEIVTRMKYDCTSERNRTIAVPYCREE